MKRSTAVNARAEPDSSSARTHRSLERGLAVLEFVAAADAPVALSDAARRIGLHRSTAHHLMQTLVGLGWLRQEEDRRSYALTARLHQLTGRRWSAAQIGELAQPYLEQLTRETGEGTSVAAWIDGTVTIAAKREADGPVRVVQDVGAVRPIYCTAVGKALAAWLPRAEVLAALARQPMVALTPKTITTREAFETELRRIRNAGYAIDDEEQFEGLRCIAMPVFCYTGEVIACMCVLGPKQRMTHHKLVVVRTPLEALARQLSERLGYLRAQYPLTISRRQA
jgi:DNA-binding IclR family transcriptional regulator